MAYCLDFTAPYHARYQRWMCVAWLLLLMAGAALALAGYWLYAAWESPTLAQKMSEYSRHAMPLQNLYQKWEQAHTEYQALQPWYRLYWATNATDTAATLLARVQKLPATCQSVQWDLKTGGEGRLLFTWTLDPDSDVLLSDQEASAKTHLLSLADTEWKAEVRRTNPGFLADLQQLELQVSFSLPSVDHRRVPALPPELERAVKKVEDRQDKIMEHLFKGPDGQIRSMSTLIQEAKSAVEALLMPHNSETKRWGQRADQVMDPSALLLVMDKELRGANVAAPAVLQRVQENWDWLAGRRWPWQRVKKLDDLSFVQEINSLSVLNNSGLPMASEFDPVFSRCEELRQALREGMDQDDAFQEGGARKWIESALTGLPGIQFTLEDETESHDGLILAKWSLNMASSSSKDHISVEAAYLIQALSDLVRQEAGFMIDSIYLEFDSRAYTVSTCRVMGLLAIRSGSFTPQLNSLP